jgi:hypothetical protein
MGRRSVAKEANPGAGLLDQLDILETGVSHEWDTPVPLKFS